MNVGKVIAGSAGDKVFIRVKSDSKVDIGDILTVKDGASTYFIKVINIGLTSQVPSQFIEDIAGQKLEHDVDLNLFDEQDRFYRVCQAKILKIRNGGCFLPARRMPNFFSDASEASALDFEFLNNKGEVIIGNLRLGTKVLKDVSIKLPASTLISHHVLVSAATGRGKSNFAKVFVKGLTELDCVSCLVLDPHNEYYGSKGVKGLRDYNHDNKIILFTPRTSDYPGSEELKIHAEDLDPSDFFGVISLSDTQQQAMELAYRVYGSGWLNNILADKNINEVVNDFQGKVLPITIGSLKRKLNHVLELEPSNPPKGLTFTLEKKSETSIFDKIKRAVNESRVIIIDTSLVGDEAEKLIASSIVRKLFSLYRRTKQLAPDKFDTLPELMILFEEAPRVLGSEALAQGPNVFSRIAREGRKFKVGLCAITQMPNLLPREILSQMNTKIILGIPSPADRQAVIESSTQNISDESIEIQMLDKGEALITSPFIDFPLPVKIFDFKDLVKKKSSSEVNIGVA